MYRLNAVFDGEGYEVTCPQVPGWRTWVRGSTTRVLRIAMARLFEERAAALRATADDDSVAAVPRVLASLTFDTEFDHTWHHASLPREVERFGRRRCST